MVWQESDSLRHTEWHVCAGIYLTCGTLGIVNWNEPNNGRALLVLYDQGFPVMLASRPWRVELWYIPNTTGIWSRYCEIRFFVGVVLCLDCGGVVYEFMFVPGLINNSSVVVHGNDLTFRMLMAIYWFSDLAIEINLIFIGGVGIYLRWMEVCISIDFDLCAGRKITDLTIAVDCCGSSVNIEMCLICVLGPKRTCL